jgi:hypothetical protein
LLTSLHNIPDHFSSVLKVLVEFGDYIIYSRSFSAVFFLKIFLSLNSACAKVDCCIDSEGRDKLESLDTNLQHANGMTDWNAGKEVSTQKQL